MLVVAVVVVVVVIRSVHRFALEARGVVCVPYLVVSCCNQWVLSYRVANHMLFSDACSMYVSMCARRVVSG